MDPGFGARLRAHREERRLTLQAIAAQTKIKQSLWIGLERNDFSKWPTGIFARAFVRDYARAIGLEPETVVREFLERHPDPIEQTLFGPGGAPLTESDLVHVHAEPATRLQRLIGAARTAVPTLLNRGDRANKLETRSQPVPDAAERQQPGPPVVASAPAQARTPVDRSDDSRPEIDLRALAELCTRFAIVADGEQFKTALAETARILHAVGVMVWCWDAGSALLTPVAAHGYSDAVVARLPRLEWLHVTRGGVYTFLTPQVKKRPIVVTCSRGIHGSRFAEFALAQMFSLAKRIPQVVRAQDKKEWSRVKPEELSGMTLGVVGLGTIGSDLAAKGKALGMRVLATKRIVTEKPDYVDELGAPGFLPDLLAQSDYVVLLLASVPATFNIIGENELRRMKPGAYLINLTGGRAIEETLLIRALKERWIAGAALDAFAKQPLPPDSELWNLPNVIITPRIAGITSQKWPALLPIFQENLRRFVAGESLYNLVDKELGY